MDIHNQVHAAICAFNGWDRPWEFHDRVVQSPLLDERARALFERLWQLARDSPHWREAVDLSAAADLVRLSLQEVELSLPGRAVDGIVRAASYEWR